MSARTTTGWGRCRKPVTDPLPRSPRSWVSKTQLAGGKIMVTKRTWYAHLHKGKNTARLPARTGRDQRRPRGSAHHWLSQPGMRDLIARFWPVPTWPVDVLSAGTGIFCRRHSSRTFKGAREAQVVYA